jgi:hypothetical protein
MTVKRLIALLQKQDPKAIVYIDGCDCVGLACDVEKYDCYEKLPAVLIGREP